MSTPCTMPALGESVTEGTVTRWLKQVGDHVEVDEPLLEVSTDKVDTEIPSPGRRRAAADPRRARTRPSPSAPSSPSSATARRAARLRRRPPARPQPGRRPTGCRRPARRPQPPARPRRRRRPSSRPPSGRRRARAAAPRRRRRDAACTMPALGESVTEGTVTRWLKQVGDTGRGRRAAARGLHRQGRHRDPVARSPASSSKILVGEDETVAGRRRRWPSIGVGSGAAASARPRRGRRTGGSGACSRPAARPARPAGQPRGLGAPRRAGSGPPPGCRTRQPRDADIGSRPARPPAPASPAAGAGVRAHRARLTARRASAYVTPLVRKLAAEHGVDLAPVTGTGVGGRIRKQDVLDAGRSGRRQAAAGACRARLPARRHPALPATAGGRDLSALRGTTEKMSRLRKVIAQRMVESLQVSAQLTTVVEVDVTRIARLRDRAKARLRGARGRQAVVPAVLRLAAVEALKQLPGGQREHRRRRDRLPRRGEPRRRGRHRARPARAR